MRFGRLFPLIIAIYLTALPGAFGAQPTEAGTGGESPLHEAGKDEPASREYRTPLAGEGFRTVLFGKPIDVPPPCDRDDIRALAIGGNIYSPKVGDDFAIPIAGLYWRKQTDRYRLRAVVGGFMNEVEVARRFGNVEIIGRWENDTVPFPSMEIADGEAVKESSIIWGTLSALAGAGLRFPVYPFQSDNDLRLQLFYHAGYLYSRPTEDTGSTVQLPPDTFLHGIMLRGHYDGMRRNMMEMVHEGKAGGFELHLMRRDRWGDASFGGNIFRREDTRDFLKLSGHLVVASKVPWLTERDRLIVSLHGGFSPARNLDRFSSFRIGGGLFPNEADDLRRPYFPGALYNHFPLTKYVMTNFEYRREIFFFLFLHLRGTLISGNRPDFSTPEFKFLKDRGEAFSAGITCGLPFTSMIYLEYGYDMEVLRDDKPGSSFLVLWSKAF